MRRRAALIVAAAVLVLAGILAAHGTAVLTWLVPRAAGLATHTNVALDSLSVTSSRIVLGGVHVRRDGDPLLDASRIEIDYALRDLLPGSRHRFGLRGVTVDGATFTLVRQADGSYSIPLHAPSSGPPRPAWPNRVPLAFTLHVRNSAIALRAPAALDPRARAFDLRDITAQAVVDSSGRTQYRVTAAFAQPVRQPIAVAGVVDVPRGFAMHHVTAASVPAREITNFFVNTPAFGILTGQARNVDFTAYALGLQADAPAEYHVSGRVDIRDTSIHVVGLNAPVERLNGTVQMVDDQMFFSHLTGQVADLPLDATGAVFNFDDPRFRIGIGIDGNLSSLRRLFKFMSDQDIAGPARIAVEVEGPVSQPDILATVDSRALEYRKIAFDDLHARIGYTNSTVSFLPIVAHAQGADVTIRGGLTIGDTVHTQAEVHVEAPADALPYAGDLLGTEPLVMDAILDGTDTNFYGYGSLASRRGIDRVAVVMHADPSGILDVAPLEMHTARGSLAAAYHLDRHTDRSAFWLDAKHIVLHTPAQPSFLGVTLPAIPPIEGTVDRFTVVAGGRSGNDALVAGAADAHALTISGVPFDRLHARFAGTLGDAVIDPVVASGAWGTLDGSGVLSLGGSIAVRGTYAGSLDGLRPFLDGAPATGSVAGTAAFAMSNGRITIQADRLTLAHASVRGIPLSSASGTITLDGGNVRIYNARASIAGGTVVAAGTYAHGISLIANNLDGSHLQGMGLPLDGGRIDAEGQVRSGAPIPQFSGGVSVADGRVQDFSVAGSGLVDLHGDGAQLAHVVGGVDGIYAIAGGNLSDLSSGAPQYAVKADVPAGDLSKAIATLDLPGYHSDGTFNARLAIDGAGLNPDVRGAFGVPAGSVNGLPFIDARTTIAANRTGVIAREGSVTVGSTTLGFAAAENPNVSALHLVTAHTDLSDFNNFFDTGDTLDGNGSLRFDVISQGHRISTNGAIEIAAFRYRNLPIGDTTASWSSAHNVLDGSLDIGGPQGTLRSHGSIAIAGEHQPLDVLRDSRYDLTAALSDVDLSTWIAALGYPQVALNGRIDANATLDGRFPHVAFRANASMGQGAIWRLPIDAAQLALSSSGDRISIDSASLQAPGLLARASGSFGLSTSDKLALSLYASSDDIPLLTQQLFRFQPPLKGTFESTLSVGGTFAHPTFDAAFDASNATIYGVDVPLLFGSVQLHDRALVLQNAGVQLANGTMTVEGSLPISLQPFAIGPPSAPVSFDISVNQVDPSAFDALLGNATKLGGTIDGTVGIGGTIAAPAIAGRFSIAKGSYVSNLDSTPITAVNATLTFDRTQGALQSFAARVGDGTFNASGTMTFASGAFSIAAKAHGAQINSPVYGNGSIDANVTLAKTAGQPNALLSGAATIQSATIPFAAFLAATQSGNGPALPPLPLAFDFNIDAGKNVRVRGSGYGAGLDIGATGKVHVAGTLSAPSLDGRFSATSGTLTYFDRAFRVQQAHVDFDPASGIIPTLSATGTTRITNPDPNTALNPYGSTDVTVAVTGPINALKVEFTSNPPGYSNEQILAMIAPFGGLINSYSYAPSLSTGIPGTASQTAINAAAPIPGAQAVGGPSAGLSVGQEAFNILNAQFSAGLLSPFEGALSQGLGLQNVNLTLDYYGNVGISATRVLGKTVNLIYNQSFGIPQRTSFGFQLLGERATSAQLTFYFETGPQVLYQIPTASAANANRVTIGEPLTGQSGFAFTLQRLFW